MHVLGTDPTRRTAGQYARATVQRLRMRTLVWLGALAVETAAAGKIFGLHDARFIFAEIALLISMFVISRFVLPSVDRGERGASGEEHVGALLDSFCSADWTVMHDVSLGHGNVDHLVIGPGGMYTIETKSREGPVRVARVHGGTLEQARAERRGIEAATGLKAEPLIVYSRAWVDRPLARRKGVRLLPARMLVRYLQQRPQRLSPEQIEEAESKVVQALLEERSRVVRGRLHLPLPTRPAA
jgi:hypothetical protein